MARPKTPPKAQAQASLRLLDQLAEVHDGQQALEALVDLIHPVGHNDCETIPTSRTATATLMRVVANNLREKLAAVDSLSQQMHQHSCARSPHS